MNTYKIGVLSVALAFINISCKKSTFSIEPNAPFHKSEGWSKNKADALAELISEHGGRAYLEGGGPHSVTLIETPGQCIPFINQISRLDFFVIGSNKHSITGSEFSKLRVFPETTGFDIIGGYMSPEALVQMAEKFPAITTFSIWGKNVADLTKFPICKELKSFSSYDRFLITEKIAQRICLSKNLEAIHIGNASSKKVFELLKSLPNIRRIKVTVFNINMVPTHYSFSRQLPLNED